MSDYWNRHYFQNRKRGIFSEDLYFLKKYRTSLLSCWSMPPQRSLPLSIPYWLNNNRDEIKMKSSLPFYFPSLVLSKLLWFNLDSNSAGSGLLNGVGTLRWFWSFDLSQQILYLIFELPGFWKKETMEPGEEVDYVKVIGHIFILDRGTLTNECYGSWNIVPGNRIECENAFSCMWE